MQDLLSSITCRLSSCNMTAFTEYKRWKLLPCNIRDINLHFSMVTLIYTFLFERPHWSSILRYTNQIFFLNAQNVYPLRILEVWGESWVFILTLPAENWRCYWIIWAKWLGLVFYRLSKMGLFVFFPKITGTFFPQILQISLQKGFGRCHVSYISLFWSVKFV